MLYRASAPGSIMLLGEHAVLQGYPALICAVDKRITVTLAPREDDQIHISSSLGQMTTTIFTLKGNEKFKFVLAVLKKFQHYFSVGFTLTIESEFSDQIGLASSAAVTVATFSVLSTWLDKSYSSLEIAREVRTIIRSVQGVGSGADVAACVFGGVIAYSAKPFSIKRIASRYPLTLFYSGSKTPTVDVIRSVAESFKHQAKVFQQILRAIGSCAKQGMVAAKKQQWTTLGALMNVQQGLMQALGVSTPALNRITEALQADTGILGAKISGSGLGDCIVGLGAVSEEFHFTQPGVVPISINIAEQGVFCEKI